MARRRFCKNQAQHKLGLDVWRSIYYRQEWDLPWLRIAPTVTRLRRWTLRKAMKPPTIYRRLKEYEGRGEKKAA